MPPTALRLVFLFTAALLIAGCTTTTTPVDTETANPVAEQPVPQNSTEEDEEETGYIEICVKKKTRVRVNYRPCDDAEPGIAWYFFPLTARIPATGSKAKRGSFKEPRGSGYRAPAKGGLGSDVMLTDVDDRVKVCVRKATRIRFANIRCDDGEKGYGWYYIRIDGSVPAMAKKADDGSFREPYAEAYSARRSGGDAAKAAIGYQDPDAPEPEEEESDEEYCTTTINNECVATNECTETVNGVCTKTEDGYLSTPSSKKCRNVWVRKRWTRRC
ncbi:hypothetical protein [Nonomuraea sp. NEAU-A123]|uniref:hypothetical protein n=1 Tax=Nonomuraea sp. NEAU-A123 TaxID=2839649 RepID=UPI001BE42C34|nr:hypothetical protein [Nonomuraea sp. NEAU-A123]MBT2233835.1 hypothetical protein [Nonomuraea sp. NEAU-A123]